MRRLTSGIMAAGLIGVLAAPVAAAKPEISTFEIDEGPLLDELASEDCGFPVMFSAHGTVREKASIDAEGNAKRLISNINVHIEFSANGRTLRAVDTGMDKQTFFADGSFTVAIHGSVGLMTVPGSGPVLGSAGRAVLLFTPVLDANGEPVLDTEGFPIFEIDVVSESGAFGSGEIEVFCNYLAG